jgi:hypothetical protein
VLKDILKTLQKKQIEHIKEVKSSGAHIDFDKLKIDGKNILDEFDFDFDFELDSNSNKLI